MALYDFNRVRPQVEAVIRRIRAEPFTSHHFILQFAKAYPRQYIDVLAAYRNSKQPFAAAHLGLSKFLRKVTLVKYLRQVPSVDIFGDKENCALWERA